MPGDPGPSTSSHGEPLASAFSATPIPKGSGQLSADELITLNEEIAGMARAGLPLDQGLKELGREMGRSRLRRVTLQMANDLRAGLTLPQALERQKGRVPPFYAALLAAGIRSGRIGTVLGTLTLYVRSMADFRGAIATALLYPFILMVLGLGLLAFLGHAVLPLVVDSFAKWEFQEPSLPALTRLLMFLGAHPLETLVFPPVAVLVTLATLRWGLASTARGRVIWARFIYAVPVVGTLVRSARLAAFAELLGILVDESVPLPEGLRLAAAASSDPILAEGAEPAEQDVRQGLPLGEALSRHALVPKLVVWMAGFGEKQGALGPALHQVALMYRRQAEVRATLLRTVLPPLAIVVLATILGVLFIFGLIVPVSGMMEQLGGTRIMRK